MITSTSLQQGNREMQDRAQIFQFGGRLILAVADGAGGIAGGADAADVFMQMVREAASSLHESKDCSRLLETIDDTLAARHECGETTGVLVGINDSHLFGASVGDSAAKWYGSNTTDDLTRGQFRKPFLGTGSAIAHSFSRNLNGGTIAIATDGLWKYTSNERIEDCVRSSNPGELAERLSGLVCLPSGNFPDDVAILTCRIP